MRGIINLNNLSSITSLPAVSFNVISPQYIAYHQYGDKIRVDEQARMYFLDIVNWEVDTALFPSIPNNQYYGVPEYNNTFYTMVGGAVGMQMLPYNQIPVENAPIVWKIFEGQKYSGYKELEIIGKTIITTAQQTATSDIVIKLGDYNSLGKFKLLIERGGN